MASFISRLFGGGKKKSAPAPAAAPVAKAAPKKEGRSFRPKKASRSVYTSALGLTNAEKSGMAIKTMLGQ